MIPSAYAGKRGYVGLGIPARSYLLRPCESRLQALISDAKRAAILGDLRLMDGQNDV